MLQMTIDQAGIETAIKNHIKNIVNIPVEDIEIDLRATRGEGGYTAVININDGAPASESPAKAPKEPVNREAVRSTPKPAPAAEEAPVSQEEQDARVADATDLNAAPAEEEQNEEPEVEETPRRQSLFGGAGRPSNKG